MTKPTNIEMFPVAKRLKQVTEGTNMATRYATRKLRKELGLETHDNVVDLAAKREENLMETLGN